MGDVVHINVKMDADYDTKIMSLPQVKAALTRRAMDIAVEASAKGNPSGIWHEYDDAPQPGHGTWVDHANPYKEIKAVYGPSPADYEFLPARMVGNTPEAYAHTGNYAACKDNTQNNTLLKARG